MTDTTTTPASHLDLTEQERQAGLDLQQLKQLVGLVEYDENQDPFPVTGWVMPTERLSESTLDSQLTAGSTVPVVSL